jgi:hypothetical protein
MGTAVHQIVLGGDNVRVFEGATFRGKAADLFKQQNQGYTHLTQVEWAAAQDIADGVTNHPSWANISIGDKEVAGLGEYKGIFCKAKADILNQGQGICVDLKTTADIHDFGRSMFKYRYDIQAAWYNRIFGTTRFIFVAVETAQPHAVRFFELDAEVIANANMDIDIAMQTYRECIDTGKWPSYSDEIVQIGLPAWMKKG